MEDDVARLTEISEATELALKVLFDELVKAKVISRKRVIDGLRHYEDHLGHKRKTPAIGNLRRLLDG